MKHAFIIALSVLAFSAAGAEVAVLTGASTGETTNAPAQQSTNAPIKELADSLFQGRAGNGINCQPTPMVRLEPNDISVTSYRSGIELRASNPLNVVQSKKYPGLEYSGSLVQALQSNPFQLSNPFAPAKYGDGQANLVINPRHETGRGTEAVADLILNRAVGFTEGEVWERHHRVTGRGNVSVPSHDLRQAIDGAFSVRSRGYDGSLKSTAPKFFEVLCREMPANGARISDRVPPPLPRTQPDSPWLAGGAGSGGNNSHPNKNR